MSRKSGIFNFIKLPNLMIGLVAACVCFTCGDSLAGTKSRVNLQDYPAIVRVYEQYDDYDSAYVVYGACVDKNLIIVAPGSFNVSNDDICEAEENGERYFVINSQGEQADIEYIYEGNESNDDIDIEIYIKLLKTDKNICETVAPVAIIENPQAPLQYYYILPEAPKEKIDEARQKLRDKYNFLKTMTSNDRCAYTKWYKDITDLETFVTWNTEKREEEYGNKNGYRSYSCYDDTYHEELEDAIWECCRQGPEMYISENMPSFYFEELDQIDNSRLQYYRDDISAENIEEQWDSASIDFFGQIDYRGDAVDVPVFNTDNNFIGFTAFRHEGYDKSRLLVSPDYYMKSKQEYDVFKKLLRDIKNKKRMLQGEFVQKIYQYLWPEDYADEEYDDSDDGDCHIKNEESGKETDDTPKQPLADVVAAVSGQTNASAGDAIQSLTGVNASGGTDAIQSLTGVNASGGTDAQTVTEQELQQLNESIVNRMENIDTISDAQVVGLVNDIKKYKDWSAELEKARKREQSFENKLIGALGMGATGIGGSMLMSGLAESAADADAERAMKAYLSTFTCKYGNESVSGGTMNVEIPGGNELINMYSEYVALANDLKMRKAALGMKPGIESEPILDSATSGLYDDVGTGRGKGAYASLARALEDPDGEDAKAWAAQREESEKKTKTGAITAGVGAGASLIGNIAINGDKDNKDNEE